MADGGIQVVQVPRAVISRGEKGRQVVYTCCSVRMISWGVGHAVLSMADGGFQVVQVACPVISRGEKCRQIV
jgi:hypothetical protein